MILATCDLSQRWCGCAHFRVNTTASSGGLFTGLRASHPAISAIAMQQSYYRVWMSNVPVWILLIYHGSGVLTPFTSRITSTLINFLSFWLWICWFSFSYYLLQKVIKQLISFKTSKYIIDLIFHYIKCKICLSISHFVALLGQLPITHNIQLCGLDCFINFHLIY